MSKSTTTDSAAPASTLLARLSSIDTPTVCNAIEIVQGKRGFDAFTRGTVVMAQNNTDVLCGIARTATIAGAQPSKESPETIKAKRLEYFRYMAAESPYPTITVVEDIDYPHCVGAWWGEVHTVVHKGLGIQGALTNGVVRDLGDLAPEFPVIAGSIGPSHRFVHLQAIGEPATVFGLTINHGDLIHADQHGAVVIPESVFSDLEAAIERLMAAEDLILEPARAEGFNLEKLEIAWKAFEKARV